MDTLNPTNDSKIKTIVIFISFIAICRLIPHPTNFSPLAAMALFGGTYIKNKKFAFLIPISIMLLSDILLQLVVGNGFNNQMIWVYGSIALTTCLGFFLRGREQRQTIMVASLLGSILFFFITNFGFWTTGYYGYTLSGLGTCYVMAIPFFKGTIMGDLFFNLVLFGGYSLLRWATPIFLGKRID